MFVPSLSWCTKSIFIVQHVRKKRPFAYLYAEGMKSDDDRSTGDDVDGAEAAKVESNGRGGGFAEQGAEQDLVRACA